VQYKSGTPHTPDNIIDVGDNVQSAITGAKKRAINRLTGIGDDIYGKRSDIAGAGTYESVLETTGNMKAFTVLLGKNKVLVSEACKILEIEQLEDITDFAEAWNKIKEVKKIK